MGSARRVSVGGGKGASGGQGPGPCPPLTVATVHPPTPAGFQWSGCSDNIAYGVAFSQSFVDVRERSKGASSSRALMNLHNNEAGRKVVQHIPCHHHRQGKGSLCRTPPGTTRSTCSGSHQHQHPPWASGLGAAGGEAARWAGITEQYVPLTRPPTSLCPHTHPFEAAELGCERGVNTDHVPPPHVLPTAPGQLRCSRALPHVATGHSLSCVTRPSEMLLLHLHQVPQGQGQGLQLSPSQLTGPPQCTAGSVGCTTGNLPPILWHFPPPPSPAPPAAPPPPLPNPFRLLMGPLPSPPPAGYPDTHAGGVQVPRGVGLL